MLASTDRVWASRPRLGAGWSRAAPCWRWGRRARSGWRSSRGCGGACWWWRWCPRRARGSTRTRCCSASRACLATTTSCQRVKLESVLDIGKLLFWLVSWEATQERFLLHSSTPLTYQGPFTILHEIAEVPARLELELQIQLKKQSFMWVANFYSRLWFLLFILIRGPNITVQVIYIPMKWNKLQCKFSFLNMKLPINKAI